MKNKTINLEKTVLAFRTQDKRIANPLKKRNKKSP
jgi:hypothetical protein